MKTSIVVTAEPSAPMYGTEAQALAATGHKEGSGNGATWAVWLTRGGDLCELLQWGFTDLRSAEEYAQALAMDIARDAGTDSEGLKRKKVVRVN